MQHLHDRGRRPSHRLDGLILESVYSPPIIDPHAKEIEQDWIVDGLPLLMENIRVADGVPPQGIVVVTLRKDVPLPTGIRPYMLSSGNSSTLHSVGDLGHHQFHQTMTSLEESTRREVGRVVPCTVSSHSMDATVKTSNTTPRSMVIGMIAGGKGVLDGELVGHGALEVMGREETNVMIGWKGIQ